MESEEMKTFWLFRLRFRWAYDSTYDSTYNSDFQFSLGHKISYDSNYDSDSVPSENQPLICATMLHINFNLVASPCYTVTLFYATKLR